MDMTEPRNDQYPPSDVRFGQAVGAASIDGNIDSRAAVSAAGAIVGEEDQLIATIVKTAA
ncbi:hypothetical protein [Pseudonocardia alaniniphila]|uniref:Uncharacterized protein n=1 Tax=Pseudonocardia alaniniphila TaxID=75291 RepID=A0ABS9TFZ8_9PSEU|nr:hypothetical protein [Pseudonocardia alaniniphila]MCH6167418.1 hypothetical protein [Pseudonocardia alaniniphila]